MLGLSVDWHRALRLGWRRALSEIAAWGDPWHPIGWLLSMFFLLIAFSPSQAGLADGLEDVSKAENSVLSILDLVLCSLAPLEFPHGAMERRRAFRRVRLGSLVLEELCYWSSLSAGLVSYCYFARDPVSLLRLGLSKLFGFNILSYEAALFVLWLTTYVFTLLLVDLFFDSYVVTSVTALIFNFLPFAFIYTFAGYRYPMAMAISCGLSVFSAPGV